MSDDRLDKGMIIDFHSHILPEMDDGSQSPEESVQMLKACAEQGVDCVILTPHFYANRDNPEHFLEKRERSLAKLREAMQGSDCPQLIPAAEVEYFEGITAMKQLDDMRIGDSKGLLIEMPFRAWSKRMVSDIIEIHNRRNFRVVLAHIERYMKLQNEDTLVSLIQAGIRMQSNASFFTESLLSARKALRAFDQGFIHLLGSDCHNTTTRKPNLKSACDYLTKKRGSDALNHIMSRAANIITDRAGVKAGGTV